jgi:hypothetical protein
MMVAASVTVSFPAMNSRASNGESSASSTEKFRFHGHPCWEMWRDHRCEIPLLTCCFAIWKLTGQRCCTPQLPANDLVNMRLGAKRGI